MPSQKRHKLDDKADKGIFLGYSSQCKGYRVYNPQNNKLQVSRDVVFNEDASWDWKNNDINKKYVITETFQQEPTPVIVGQPQEPVEEESESSSDEPDSPRYEYDIFRIHLHKKLEDCLSYTIILNKYLILILNRSNFVILFQTNQITMRKQLNIKYGEMQWKKKYP